MRWWNDHVPDARIVYMKQCREAAEDMARELVERHTSTMAKDASHKPDVGDGTQERANDVMSRLST